MKPIAILLCTLAAVHASKASAQQLNIKPGLWQIDMTMHGTMNGNPMAGYITQMKSQMASMPPEQRKQIASMLADLEARGTEFTSNGLRTKECMTEESMADFSFLHKKGMESCSRKTSPAPGGLKLSMQCARPQMQIEGSLKYQGEKAYTFESTATVPGPDGKPVVQKSRGTAKWLGSDCGKIKPASVHQ